MTIDSVTDQLTKSIALIALGLLEKEQSPNPKKYTYSKRLMHGINLFLYTSDQYGGKPNVIQPFANEASFLRNLATQPISEWFRRLWLDSNLDAYHIRDQYFYQYQPLIYELNETHYMTSDECQEVVAVLDKNVLLGLDQFSVYSELASLDQQTYTQIRTFLIENPIVSKKDLLNAYLSHYHVQYEKEQKIKIKLLLTEKAYEPFYGDYWECPQCHWTLKDRGNNSFYCHSPYCVETLPNLSGVTKKTGGSDTYRLKKGVMRFIAAPGQYELELAKFCADKHLRYQLWPEMDRYDLQIIFDDSAIWQIDVKAYRNPLTLKRHIANDNAFPVGRCEKAFYVVPHSYVPKNSNYLTLINSALQNRPTNNVRCITTTQLKQEISRKERDIHA